MTCEEAVRAAPNPQAALIEIARALDDLGNLLARDDRGSDPWGEWGVESLTVQPEPAVQIHQSGDTATVELPPVDPDLHQARLEFARGQLKLSEALGPDEDWDIAYASGGPLWLYLGNRDLVMSYPTEVKRAMVADVEKFAPRDAADMARDILKVPTEMGPANG